MKTFMTIAALVFCTNVSAAPDREKACPILAKFAYTLTEAKYGGVSLYTAREAIQRSDSSRESREVAGRVINKVYLGSSSVLKPEEVAMDIYEGCMRGEYY